ncbi:MAG: D-alanyl-D-alanine carboxypeptidase/D-alanyl-D-alanine-endopeptidase [Pseudomonadota bacterium]
MRSPLRVPRRAALAGLAALLLAGAAQAGAPARSDFPPPRPDPGARPPAPTGLAAPIAEARAPSGRLGYALIDLETGEMLEARAADETFPPASVAKVFTALYALETLGPDHRFETRLVAGTPLREGRVEGDLALVGGGDPELDTDAIAELAAQARDRGLRAIAGRYLAQADLWPETPRIDPGQPEEAPYNPAVSSLNLDFNRVLFSWQRNGGAYDLSLEARGLRESTAPRLVSIELGDDLPRVFLREEAGGAARWRVAEAALGGGGKRWLPVRRPALHAAEVLRSFAERNGARLPPAAIGHAPEGGVPLATWRSRPLREILRDMLDYSTNLTAEVTGLAATRARGRPVRELELSGAAMTDWAARRAAEGAGLSAPPPPKPKALRAASASAAARPVKAAPALSAGIAATMLSRTGAGVPASALARGGEALPGIDLRNHSGLTRDSRVSPLAMTALLRAADLRGGGRGRPGELEGLLDEVDLRGEHRLPEGASAVAKTGTLYFVRGLAGYITSSSGRRLAFAIFSEDLARREALGDVSSGRGSRGWLARARELERRVVRAWAAGY